MTIFPAAVTKFPACMTRFPAAMTSCSSGSTSPRAAAFHHRLLGCTTSRRLDLGGFRANTIIILLSRGKVGGLAGKLVGWRERLVGWREGLVGIMRRAWRVLGDDSLPLRCFSSFVMAGMVYCHQV